jgi:hypothetical protein
MSEKVKPTVKEVFERMLSLVGNPQYVPKCKNKGKPGLHAEDKSGIRQSRDHLDCKDGELKTCPIEFNSKGKLIAEGTMSITMISTEELDENDFDNSNCWTKIKNTVFVLRFRSGDYLYHQHPISIDFTLPVNSHIKEIFEKDYNAIREFYKKNGTLSKSGGKMCKYIENRTKGSKKNPGRAFYLKMQFVNEVLIPRLPYTIMPSDIIIAKKQ